jgi:Zn finger protein HypA/HybF involved in hydrogenase expression
MSQLNANATRYAAEMIAEHGVEGAKKIATDIEARRCPDCGKVRSETEVFAETCLDCGLCPF